MKRPLQLIALIVAAALALSCNQTSGLVESTGGDANQPPVSGGAAEVPYSCEPPATPIEANTSLNLRMHLTNQGYPANCLYYCLPVSGGDNLEIGISGLIADLDLYVGFGSLAAVTGGQSYNWTSREPGTMNERVTIPSPDAGIYYIEVCSYEGDPSPFTLRTSVR